MNKILKYLSKRFREAESLENELMIFETEIKHWSNIYERRKREINKKPIRGKIMIIKFKDYEFEIWEDMGKFWLREILKLCYNEDCEEIIKKAINTIYKNQNKESNFIFTNIFDEDDFEY